MKDNYDWIPCLLIICLLALIVIAPVTAQVDRPNSSPSLTGTYTVCNHPLQSGAGLIDILVLSYLGIHHRRSQTNPE
jgi:hypothetical protein